MPRFYPTVSDADLTVLPSSYCLTKTGPSFPSLTKLQYGSVWLVVGWDLLCSSLDSGLLKSLNMTSHPKLEPGVQPWCYIRSMTGSSMQLGKSQCCVSASLWPIAKQRNISRGRPQAAGWKFGGSSLHSVHNLKSVFSVLSFSEKRQENPRESKMPDLVSFRCVFCACTMTSAACGSAMLTWLVAHRPQVVSL